MVAALFARRRRRDHHHSKRRRTPQHHHPHHHQCLICFTPATDLHQCRRCRNIVCVACADRCLSPSCPFCRAPTWGVELRERRGSDPFGIGMTYMTLALGAHPEYRDRAIKYLSIAAASNDNNRVAAAHNLGTMYMTSSKLGLARKYLHRAAMPVSNLNLAFVYGRIGDRDARLRSLRRAARGLCGPAFFWLSLEYLHSDPSNHNASQALVEVAAALGDLRALEYLARRDDDACRGAAFLALMRDLLDDDDKTLLARHEAECRLSVCPAKNHVCLCRLIPRAFDFVRTKRANLPFPTAVPLCCSCGGEESDHHHHHHHHHPGVCGENDY